MATRPFCLTDAGGQALLDTYFNSQAKENHKLILFTNTLGTTTGHTAMPVFSDKIIAADLTASTATGYAPITLVQGNFTQTVPTGLTDPARITSTANIFNFTLGGAAIVGFAVIGVSSKIVIWTEGIWIDADGNGTAEATTFTPTGTSSSLSITLILQLGTATYDVII